VLATGGHAELTGPDQCTISPPRLFVYDPAFDGTTSYDTERARHRWHTRNRGSQLHVTQGCHKVVAVYHGNDQVAERFKRDTGIPVVTVNAICPGYIATGMVRAMPVEVVEKKILPLILVGRLCEAEEVARAVRLFLASDDAGFITGSTMTVNGGQYMP